MTHNANHNQSHRDDCLFCMDHLHEAALGILEPDDRSRLEHHLAECGVCRAELAELDATVNLLPLSVDQVQPRAEVKATLRDRLNAEMNAPQSPAPVETKPTSRKEQKQRTFTPRRPMWALGSVFAGLCVALLAIGAWTFLPIGNDDDNAPRGQMSVLAMETSDCPGCHEDTRGHIGANLETSDGMVVAWNLDPTEKHEVWCVNRDGKRTMVGELQVDDSGAAMQNMQFPDSVGDYDQIYVARNDGTEELTVAPNKMKSDNDSDATPPD